MNVENELDANGLHVVNLVEDLSKSSLLVWPLVNQINGALQCVDNAHDDYSDGDALDLTAVVIHGLRSIAGSPVLAPCHHTPFLVTSLNWKAYVAEFHRLYERLSPLELSLVELIGIRGYVTGPELTELDALAEKLSPYTSI